VQATGTTVSSTQTKLAFKTAGRIAAIHVSVGDTVSKGQVLAELDATNARAAVKQAQAADDAARAAVDLAKAKVQQLVESAKPQTISQANAALDAARQKLSLAESGARKEQVQQAQAALDAAQARLQALQNGPRPEQLAVLQKQIEAAKNSLFAAQTSRDGACNKVLPAYVCSAAQAQVNAAETGVDTAQKQYELATAPPTATDLAQAQSAVDQARAQLQLLQANTPQDIQAARDAVAQAQAAAQLAAQPFTGADMAVAQASVKQADAQVTQADAALDAAKTSLDDLALRAPADGKVLQVNNSVGEIVGASSANAPIVLGVGGLVVNVGLPEASFTKVKPGQDASVSFVSLPGASFTGKVAELPPVASATQTLLSYVATIKLDRLSDDIRPGMTANVTVFTVRKENVLLVPNRALRSYQGKEIVLTPNPGGPAKQVEVQIGLADGQNTELLAGLSERQQVLLVGKALNTTSSGGNV
ncbi:MAG: efflux RND transporter periplasmic adaptor subunit, partial [Chloroflexota bacterium]|nr:efflux RND transporter periplasmic adaptor subunit [Chloroflexota bacterium]